MRIDSSSISMSSKTATYQSYSSYEKLNFQTGANQSSIPPASDPQEKPAYVLDISNYGKNFQAQTSPASQEVDESGEIDFDISDMDKRKLELVQEMIEVLTGKKIRFVIPKSIKIKPDSIRLNTSVLRQAQPAPVWELQYDAGESYLEQQKMSFTSKGFVKTSDGREISFSVELNMSREFAFQNNISIRAGNAVKADPLVIQYDNAVPGLTDEKYSFDIDCDGKPDSISFTAPGSGFLALDLNSDGRINDGSELFGPKSGNGFSDLARYDSDGNNWIDENDPIYENLRIWSKEADGSDRLLALGEKGVGAIYLGNVSSEFDIKNSQNALKGEIARSGIFLKENGTAGTIHHINIAL